MTLLARPLPRGAIAAALGLALLAATPSSADDSYEPSDWEDGIAYNGGAITVDAGPAYAGYDLFVQAQLPATAYPEAGGGVWVIKKASLDVEGTATVLNFAGPVNLYFFSPSDPHTGLELPEEKTTAAIYRGAAIEYDVDPGTRTAVVDGATPSVTAPALADFGVHIVPFTNATVSPSTYSVGEPFDLTFSDLFWASPGDLDGRSTRTVVYSEPTTIGESAISGGAVTTTIGAEYTTDPHTVAVIDTYGRLLASATLDGGATAAPPSTPIAAAPTVTTGTKTGTGAGPQLAATGIETGAAALVATLLVAGGLVVARRRRTTA